MAGSWMSRSRWPSLTTRGVSTHTASATSARPKGHQIMKTQFRWGTVVLAAALGGCAAPQFKPADGHRSIAVISAINPTPVQNHMGITIFGNSATPLDLGIDINKEVKATIEDALRASGQYTLVDVPFDLHTITSAKDKR